MDADIPEGTDLFGKVVTDLQEDVALGNNAITGTLKYVEDYTSGGFDMSKGHNFIALHAESDEDATITVEVVGGESGPVTLDSDGIAVLQLASNTQSIKYVATKGEDSKEVTYALTDVVFNEE